MADEKGFSWKHFLLEGVLQGVLLAILALFLNERLEVYKNKLAENTEMLKGLLQANSPLIEQRRDAYLSILQNARRLESLLEDYYYKAKGPPTDEQALERKLGGLESVMLPDSGGGGSGGSWGPSRSEAVAAVRDFVNVRNKYADICSEPIKKKLDTFLNTIMDDLTKSAQKKPENSADFDTTARDHLRSGFNDLNTSINEALGIPELPIK